MYFIILREIVVYRPPQALKNNNKFSNFNIKMNKDRCSFDLVKSGIYVVHDWHHAGRTERRKGPQFAQCLLEH